MTLYEKNLETLARYYSGMDKEIEKAKQNLNDAIRKAAEIQVEEKCEESEEKTFTVLESTENKEKIEDIKLEIEEELSEDGESILKIIKDGHQFYLGGKRNARMVPRKWRLLQGDLPTGYIYIFMGIGNARYLEELVENVESRLIIIIYEPSLKIFLNILDRFDLYEGMKKHLIVFWVEGIGEMTLEGLKPELSKMLRAEKMKKVQLFILPNYDNLFKNECDKLIRMCQEIDLSTGLAHNTRVAFSGLTAVNVLKNSRYLLDGYKTIQLIRVIPKDIPGIVVAAGPSLNKNIKELKKAKGKAFIIAVDTAIKPLLANEIIPDMFFIVDAMKPLNLIKVEEAKKIPMITTLNAAPEVLDYQDNMKFFFDEGYSFAEKILMKNEMGWGGVATGGSVATNAFSLLCRLRINTIILVGQDLAWSENKTHADGTFEEQMPEVDTSNCKWVEGNFEEKVPTSADLEGFLNWYKAEIELYKNVNSEFKVINATEGGAKIEGTEIMTLKDAIAQECKEEIDIQECLSKVPKMLTKEDRDWSLNYLKDIPKEFQDLKQEATKLNTLYKNLDKLSRQKKPDESASVKLMKKIKRQIKKVEKFDVYGLVSTTMPSAEYIMRQEEANTLDNFAQECQEIARKGKLYSDLVAQSADLLRSEALDAYKKIS